MKKKLIQSREVIKCKRLGEENLDKKNRVWRKSLNENACGRKRK
jgi:hypothetical protein